jgi:hypothetical protein
MWALALPNEEQLRRRAVIAAAIALLAFFGAVRVTKPVRLARGRAAFSVLLPS